LALAALLALHKGHARLQVLTAALAIHLLLGATYFLMVVVMGEVVAAGLAETAVVAVVLLAKAAVAVDLVVNQEQEVLIVEVPEVMLIISAGAEALVLIFAVVTLTRAVLNGAAAVVAQ
jgi:hypothetical protein